MEELQLEVLRFLQSLIEIQSFSREEELAAEHVRKQLTKKKIVFHTQGNNTWAFNKYFDEEKPTLLLNSHIDTVKPSSLWTKNPFEAVIEGGKLYGLGSNDAGGALATLWGAFLYFNEAEDLPINICWAATAEEEISGQNGIASLQELTQSCSAAIIGEPTEMQMATAERGLMVIDAEVKGVAGHAARDTGINAIYLALDDIRWIKDTTPEKHCPVLGPTKMTVTVVEAGKQHNVVPDSCKYVIDVRTTAAYDYEELIAWMQSNLKAELKPRSLRLKPSIIDENHPLVLAGLKTRRKSFGSATLSDQALLNIPSIKIGPGKSERSHTADEFIFIKELEQGLLKYIDLINNITWLPKK